MHVAFLRERLSTIPVSMFRQLLETTFVPNLLTWKFFQQL